MRKLLGSMVVRAQEYYRAATTLIGIMGKSNGRKKINDKV
jgi:hypothetical protein